MDEEEERKETYRRLHPPPVPKGTFSYDPDGDCLSVAVQKDSYSGTSIEKQEPLEKLKFYLYNEDHPRSVEKSLVYWKAQLIHHGMRSTQPKARCKIQLLDAAEAGTLRVPQNLIELEAGPKAEYHEKKRAEMTPAERVLHEQRATPEEVRPVQDAGNPTPSGKRVHYVENEERGGKKVPSCISELLRQKMLTTINFIAPMR